MGNTARRLLGAAFSASTLLGCGTSNPDVLTIRADANTTIAPPETTSTTTETTPTTTAKPETTATPTTITTINNIAGYIACTPMTRRQANGVLETLPFFYRLNTVAEAQDGLLNDFMLRLSGYLENPDTRMIPALCDVVFVNTDVPVRDVVTDQFITGPVRTTLTGTPEDLAGIEDEEYESTDCVVAGFYGDVALDESGPEPITIFVPGAYEGQSAVDLLCNKPSE